MRNKPLGLPSYLPQPGPPVSKFDILPPKLSEVREVVRKARSASAHSPNGVPCKLYKNCRAVLKQLWILMQAAWKTQIIPKAWQRALAVFIPKEKDLREIGQFRNIAFLSVEGKIFFSVLARRMANFLLDSGNINTSYQKAGVHGFPGCVEHSSVIW